MQIISLNIWSGRAGSDKLLSFFKKYKDTTDIFCLQEVWKKPLKRLEGWPSKNGPFNNKSNMSYAARDISAALPEHAGFFAPFVDEHYGILMLIRKTYPVIETGDVFVYKQNGYIAEHNIADHARSIQYMTTIMNNKSFTVINFHGLWNGKGKTDTEDRIQQSKNILTFTSKLNGEYILCGDFNLLPDTKSIKLFEEKDLRNLIKEYKVSSTRTSFYTKPEKQADYIFVTKGVKVKKFSVLPDEVSDHAPLLIEVE